jgi:16S rRNA (uracil1498-N3)-methyltransferase
MPRFYCQQPLEINLLLSLPDDIAHHIQVLRLKEGDVITLFNGEGGEYAASIERIEKKRVEARLKIFSSREAELAHSLVLAQVLPEAGKMDWIIEKAVELGATTIQPLISNRSVIRLSSERTTKKMVHWQGILAAASAQCGRNRLPHLSEPLPFMSWIEQRDLHPRLLLSPRCSQSLSAWAKHHPAQAVTLIIGPEGGLSPQEEQAAITHGALCLTMGERILRTETAGIAAMAALQSIWDSY